MKINKKDVDLFAGHFEQRLKCTPLQYIERKIKNGSRVDDVEYLFNIISAEISNRNQCAFVEFKYFYTKNII